MPLESLVQYSDEQASRINELISRGFLTDISDGRNTWDKFRDSLWGRGLQHLQLPLTYDTQSVVQDPEEIPRRARPVVKVPEEIPLPLYFFSKRILVRSEYEEAEQEILLANESGREAFMVSGNPGIGKTIFLVWLLMRRLVLRLPTVLQVAPGYALLFHNSGTSQFSDLTDLTPYEGLFFETDDHKRVWALVGSNNSVKVPAPIFLNHRPFFVVEALSPRPMRFEWTKKVDWEYFYMKTWTLSELLQARKFLVTNANKVPLEEDEVTFLYEIYGASPRDLSMKGHDPKSLRNRIDSQVREMNLASIKIALASWYIDDSSHYVTRIEPSYDERGVPCKTISCRFAFELLWDKYMKDQVSEMDYFYHLFSNDSIMASAAGWIFEFRMHQLLRDRCTIHLFPIDGHHANKSTIYNHYSPSYSPGFAKAIQLPTSEEHSLLPNMMLAIGNYYRPLNVTFPAINSLFLVELPDEPSPILLMFQMTQNKVGHDVIHMKPKGLLAVEELDLPLNTQKWLVVVTPFNVEPKIVVPPKTDAPNTNRMDINVDEAFRVFNYPVETQMMFLPTPQMGPAPET